MPELKYSEIATFDALPKNARPTADGYFAASSRIARTGIQLYKGREIGRPDMETVRIFRPADEVFSDASLKSYAHKPITVDHPQEMVNSKNWRKYAVGHTDGEVVRDGEFVRVSMLLMDQQAIDDVAEGKSELSVGYMSEIVWQNGFTDSGEAYDAIQTSIRANHLAVVAKARGGPSLKIGDINHEGDTQMPTKTLIVDGITLEMTDIAANVVQRTVEKLGDEIKTLKDALEIKVTEIEKTATEKKAAETASSAKDGEIAALKKQVEDSKMTDAQIDARVAERTLLRDQASVVLDAKFDYTGKSDAEIRRAAVAKQYGDAFVKDMDDATIVGAFKTLKPAEGNGSGVAALARNLSGQTVHVGDAAARAEAAWVKRGEELSNMWKTGKQQQQKA